MSWLGLSVMNLTAKKKGKIPVAKMTTGIFTFIPKPFVIFPDTPLIGVILILG